MIAGFAETFEIRANLCLATKLLKHRRLIVQVGANVWRRPVSVGTQQQRSG